jgi:C4-dicarboxylate transporter DctM subunit
MEAIAALIILVPVLVPVANQLGIDLTHFGVVIVFNLMLGLLTPPVGICLYISAQFAQVRVEEVFREVLPFLGAALVVLLLITAFPGLVLFLPNQLMR